MFSLLDWRKPSVPRAVRVPPSDGSDRRRNPRQLGPRPWARRTAPKRPAAALGPRVAAVELGPAGAGPLDVGLATPYPRA
jgi:hypothetical protein